MLGPTLPILRRHYSVVGKNSSDALAEQIRDVIRTINPHANVTHIVNPHVLRGRFNQKVRRMA